MRWHVACQLDTDECEPGIVQGDCEAGAPMGGWGTTKYRGGVCGARMITGGEVRTLNCPEETVWGGL